MKKIKILLITLSAMLCVYFSVHVIVMQVKRYAFPKVILSSELYDGKYIEKKVVSAGIIGYIGKAADFLFGGNFADNTLAMAVSGNFDIEKPEILPDASPTPSPPKANSSASKNIASDSGKIKLSTKISINNETKYQLNKNAFLTDEKAVNSPKRVLIVHTHATESYQPDESFNFKAASNDRSTDNNYNVIKIGDLLAEELSVHGIESVHIRNQHDYPQYNNSYARSSVSVADALKENPDINIVIDLHRDAISLADGTKAKLVSEINGESCAQVMLVVGTDELGLKHDNWHTNLKFAVQLQQEFLKISPDFPRPINLRTSRFNGHLAPGAVILEVGSAGNSFSEAAASTKHIAEAIASYIN